MKDNFVEVLGSKMHYVEAGEGDPILFLHGVPTSSYLWRHMIPEMSRLGRCIAPDLIGFGQSDKPDIEYSVFDHIKYIDGLIQKLNLKNITIVMHGWGSLIGFDYAMRHEGNCKALVFYESFLRPFDPADLALPFMEQVESFNANKEASNMILDSCFYVDKTIPQNMMNELSEDDLQVYRAPFQQKGAGKPILQYLNEISDKLAGGSVDKLVREYSKKLTQSKLPKLLLYSVPGFLTTVADIMWAKEHLPNLEIIEIGEELHYAQESHPEIMGQLVSAWLQAVEQN